jgi:hypothetical protein
MQCEKKFICCEKYIIHEKYDNRIFLFAVLSYTFHVMHFRTGIISKCQLLCYLTRKMQALVVVSSIFLAREIDHVHMFLMFSAASLFAAIDISI